MGSRDRVVQETGCVVGQQRWKDDGKKKKERDRGWPVYETSEMERRGGALPFDTTCVGRLSREI